MSHPLASVCRRIIHNLMSLANKEEREHVAVPKPRGVLPFHATVEHDPELHIQFDFAGTRRDADVSILPDGSTHPFTKPCWWSHMHPIYLDSTARAHSASSKSMSDDERKRRAKDLKHQSNAARPSTKSGRKAGREHAIAGIVVGHTVQDIVRALRPFGSKQALLNLLAKLARQADAAIGTCQGGDVGLLNMGLLSMTQDGAQARTARRPGGSEASRFYERYGVAYDQKTDGISRHRVAGPTLTIILTYEWLLAAATATEPVAGTPTVKELENFLLYETNRVALWMEKNIRSIYGDKSALRFQPSLQAGLQQWTDAEVRALRRVNHAVFNVPSGQTAQVNLRVAKMAAWPMNETLDAEEQPRLLRFVGNETYCVGLKLRGYKPPYEPPCSYEVHVQFVVLEKGVTYPKGSSLRIASSTTKGDLCLKLKEKLEEDNSNNRWYHHPPPQLHSFYVGEREIDGTLGDVVSWEQAIDDETPIPIVCKRDYAYARFVEEKFPEWDPSAAVAPTEAAAPSPVVAAAAAAARVVLAAKLLDIQSVLEIQSVQPPAADLKPAEDLKVARCLYAGMLALVTSDKDSFEFTSAMLCPDGVAPMFATQRLQNITADLERRRSSGANAPPTGKPTNRKAKRNELVVLCSIPEHRIVLADCLLDAYTAFTTETAEAKAARATFKPAIPRSNGQKGAASATDA